MSPRSAPCRAAWRRLRTARGVRRASPDGPGRERRRPDRLFSRKRRVTSAARDERAARPPAPPARSGDTAANTPRPQAPRQPPRPEERPRPSQRPYPPISKAVPLRDAAKTPPGRGPGPARRTLRRRPPRPAGRTTGHPRRRRLQNPPAHGIAACARTRSTACSRRRFPRRICCRSFLIPAGQRRVGSRALTFFMPSIGFPTKMR